MTKINEQLTLELQPKVKLKDGWIGEDKSPAGFVLDGKIWVVTEDGRTFWTDKVKEDSK